MFIDELKEYQIKCRKERIIEKENAERARLARKLTEFTTTGMNELYETFKKEALEAAKEDKNSVRFSKYIIFDEELQPYIIEFFTNEGFKIDIVVETYDDDYGGPGISSSCVISW